MCVDLCNNMLHNEFTSRLSSNAATGKDLCNGSQQERPMMPANLYLAVNPVYNANAPPWENPPRTIL